MVEEHHREDEPALGVGDGETAVTDVLDVAEVAGAHLLADAELQPLVQRELRREAHALGVQRRLEPVLESDALVGGGDQVGVVARHPVQVTVRGGDQVCPGASPRRIDDVVDVRAGFEQGLGEGGAPEERAPGHQGLDLADRAVAVGLQPDAEQRVLAGLADHAPAGQLALAGVRHHHGAPRGHSGRGRPEPLAERQLLAVLGEPDAGGQRQRRRVARRQGLEVRVKQPTPFEI